MDFTLPSQTTSEPSEAYKRQYPEWQLINLLMRGTAAIRARGEEFLPRLNKETSENYDRRLSKAVLAPYFKRTVNFSTGKAFYTPLKMLPKKENEKVDPRIQAIIDDATTRNENLNVFSANAFRDGWAKGLGFIYVDAPSYDENEVRTVADLKKKFPGGVRPYFLYVKPEQMLDIMCDSSGRIIFAKMIEYYQDFDATTAKTVVKSKLRIVTPNQIGIYYANDEQNQTTDTQRDAQSYKQYSLSTKESYKNSIGIVAIAPFYTGEKHGDFECSSALNDLAYCNIQYYQNESVHENAVCAAEFPLLVGLGFDNNTELEIGPHKIITIKDPQADLKYVEHSGNALQVGKENLEELRIKMAYCGLKALKSDYTSNNSKSTTATEIKIDNIDTNAQLRIAANSFTDAIDLAFYFASLFLSIVKADAEDADSPVYASLEGIFSMTTDDINEIVQLMNLEETGKLRLETLLLEYRRRNILASDVNIASEVEFAKNNGAYGGNPGSSLTTSNTRENGSLQPGAATPNAKTNGQRTYEKTAATAKDNKVYSTKDEFNQEVTK